jgi:hypothetical protein
MQLSKAYNKYKDVLDWCNIVKVGEHEIELPNLPVNTKDIFFIDDSPENAFWNRDRIIKQDYKPIWFKFIPNETLLVDEDDEDDEQQTVLDEDGFAVSLNKEDSDYIRFCYQREIDRRTNGVYFRNENELVYLTGDHWFTLMWCKTKRPDRKGDYFDYREYQRDFFYEIKYTVISIIVTGCMWSKAKKTGITNLMWCYFLNKSTMTKNINLGNMNIDQEKAAQTFVEHFMYAYNGLPLALKPEFKSKSEAEGRITFGRRYNNKSSKRTSDSDELNTTVMCVATVINAFDVAVFTDLWYDEFPKYKQDFGAIYRSNMGGTKIQDLIVGKQWFTSYTPEQSGASFTEGKKLFFSSELKTISSISEGKTKSGLICDHIPAFRSWASSFNKYGKCNEAEAKAKIQAELDILSDRPHEYLKKRREYANTKKDAWSVADAESIIDPIRLAELKMDLEELQRSTRVFEEGELQWVNPLWEVGKKDSRPKGVFDRVRFVPLTEDEIKKGKKGKMRRYEKLQPQFENYSLQFGKDQYGNLNPPPIFLDVSGIDPTDYRDLANAEEGSMIGMYDIIVHNETINSAQRRIATKIIRSEYYDRPDNPEEAYQDIVKWIIYHGCLVIVEANNGYVATRLEAEGLGHYMLFKDENGLFSLYDGREITLEGKEKRLKHIKNEKNGILTVSDMVIHVKSYYQRGNKEFGEKDYGETIKSERLHNQCGEVDPADTKKSDLFVGFSLGLICHDNYLALLSKPVKESDYMASEMNAVYSVLSNSFAY